MGKGTQKMEVLNLGQNVSECTGKNSGKHLGCLEFNSFSCFKLIRHYWIIHIICMYSNVLWKSLELDEYFVYFATIRTQCMDFNVLSIYAIVKSISNGISDHRYSIPKFTHKSVSKCWTNFSMHLRHFLGPDLLHPLGWSPCRNWAGWPSSKERHIFETWRCRKSWGTPNINHYKPSMLGTFMAMETSTWGCRKKSLKKKNG